MASSKSTTLPHLLKEYDPKFDEKKQTKTTPDKKVSVDHSEGEQRKGCQEKHSKSPEKRTNRNPDKGTKKSSDKGRSNTPDKGGSKTPPPPPPSREATSDFKKRQERQHNERMYAAWEQVKEDVRESEIDRLKERISLQQELHKAQEQQHEQQQEQRRQRQIKKREKEKSERAAKIDELQLVCKESLEDDRRIAKEKRVAEKAEKSHKQTDQSTLSGTLLEVPQHDNVPPHDPALRNAAPAHLEMESPALEAVSVHNSDVERDDPRGSLASAPLSLPGHSMDESTFETLMEEEEEEDDVVMEEDEVLPWHHLQLYQLYGKEADYFLHPKIETEKKTDIVLNPRLKAIGGRAGAGTLWDVLRNESRMRLVQQDSKLLSPELKSAFGAFAREGVANQQKPVKRNFSSEDVPDMERLMDQSRIHNAHDFRHKVELMFRSSTINQDRTKVLLYNNPPPDLNNKQGEEGVGRYMPSWAGIEDVESELSYTKWLRRPGESDEPLPISYTPNYDGGEDHSVTSTPRGPDSSPDRPHARRRPEHKYVFLTEERARSPGQFTRRRKELEEAKHRPAAHGDHLPDIPLQKSLSAMASLGGGDHVLSRSSTFNSGSKSQSQRARSEMSSQFVSQWEPLSLNALLEYRNNQTALGHGQFNHGKTPVWTSKTSVTAR